MSYRSDYTSRRVLSGRPGLDTSYTYTTPTRQYIAVNTPGRSNMDESSTSSYSKSYSSSSSVSSGGPGGSSRTVRTESTTRDSGTGPRGYSYTTESTRNSGGGPGSYFSSTSYKSPYGNNYRTFSSR